MYERTHLIAMALLAGIGCDTGPAGGPQDASLDGGVDAGSVVTEACARDLDCGGTFCGPARCEPGAANAEADGCVLEPSPCEPGETCDDERERCIPADCAPNADIDGDGDLRIECGGGDCDDNDGRVRSTSTEVCDNDGLNEDCDPETVSGDDGDEDRDGFVSHSCFNRLVDGSENHGSDCDDDNPGLGLGSNEHCAACGDICVIGCNEGLCESYVQIAAGSTFACALTTTGRVLCWGSGPLGSPDTISPALPTPVLTIDDAHEIVAGSSHACAIRADGSVWCWGRFGGTGTVSVIRPVEMRDEWGNDLRFFGPALQLHARGGTTCALLQLADDTRTRQVRCWGDNSLGQLGQHATGSSVPSVEPSGRALRVAEADGAIAVSVGWSHACALLDDGSVRCWGDGGWVGDGVIDHGQTCGGPDCTTAVTVAGLSEITAIDGACAWNASGTWCWNWREVPVERTDLVGVTRIDGSCAIDAAARPVCWGGNMWGTLGDGTRTSRALADAVSGLDTVTDIAWDQRTACAVDASGAAWCWGDNRTGQLGDGIDDHMMGGCSDMLSGPTYECSLVPVRVARPE